MRKVMIMAALAAMSATAFAQDDLVKQAKKLCDKGELEQAVTTITPALTSAQTEDKAEAWNVMSEIQYQIFMKGQQAEQANKENNTATPYDTAAMHRAMVASLEAALKCDEYDRQPNEKGKVKIRFRETNGKKFYMSRPFVISAGLYEYNNKNLEAAVKDWKLYIDSAEDPLFTGLDMSNDQYRSEVCYYIGLSSYNLKDYATATKYAKIAAQDSAKAKEANEIYEKGIDDTEPKTDEAKLLKQAYNQETRTCYDIYLKYQEFKFYDTKSYANRIKCVKKDFEKGLFLIVFENIETRHSRVNYFPTINHINKYLGKLHWV